MKSSNLFFLFVALTNICCANIAETIKQRNTRYKKGIVKGGILYENEWVCGGIQVGVDEDSYLRNIEHEKMKAIFSHKIEKQALSSKIKSIIYTVFFQEMGIISGDFSDMAQGNAELAQDLKELFCVSFNQSVELAQEKLDEFCTKWDLEKIEINQVHTFDIIYE